MTVADCVYTGHGAVVRHLRNNEQCGLLEELPPIDQNLKYDFNFQVHVYIQLYIATLCHCIFYTCCSFPPTANHSSP